jgi:hypothetical protein
MQPLRPLSPRPKPHRSLPLAWEILVDAPGACPPDRRNRASRWRNVGLYCEQACPAPPRGRSAFRGFEPRRAPPRWPSALQGRRGLPCASWRSAACDHRVAAWYLALGQDWQLTLEPAGNPHVPCSLGERASHAEVAV